MYTYVCSCVCLCVNRGTTTVHVKNKNNPGCESAFPSVRSIDQCGVHKACELQDSPVVTFRLSTDTLVLQCCGVALCSNPEDLNSGPQAYVTQWATSADFLSCFFFFIWEGILLWTHPHKIAINFCMPGCLAFSLQSSCLSFQIL